MLVAGVGAGQGAERHHSRHEPQIGVRFAGGNKLVDLIGEGEAPPRRWWGFAERLDQTAQIGQGITDRNQLAALTLHGSFSHRIQTPPGDNEEAMTPKLLVAAFLLNVGSLSAVELRGVVVESTEGIFLINNLKVDGSGTDQSFRVKWNGSITNNTGKEWHKVTFCGKGFEAEDKPLLAAGEPCLLRLWMYAWKPGAQMRWKGSAKMRLADGKRRVALARMEWSVSEILTDPESVLIFPQTCSRVWSAGMKVFVDSKFRPTVSDKDSFIASFEYTGGHTVARAFGNTNQLVKAYTATKIGWLTTWDAFRIESAGLMLRPGPNEGCRAQIDMSFAGFDKRWYKLGSNHQYEKGLLAKINNLVSEDYEQDLDEAIRQLPTSDPPTSERTEAAERIPATGISSDPAGAEIEIDEEFVGSTPSRINLEPGRHTIVIRKRGFSEWKRVVRVRSGDALTVHAELESKAP